MDYFELQAESTKQRNEREDKSVGFFVSSSSCSNWNLKQTLKEIEEASRDICEKSFPGRGKSQYGGHKVEPCLVYSKNSKRTKGAAKSTVSKGKTVRKGFGTLESHEALWMTVGLWFLF